MQRSQWDIQSKQSRLATTSVVKQLLAVSKRKAPGLGLALFISLFISCGLPAGVASAGAEHNIYLTRDAKDDIPLNKPREQFSCSDKIYAVLELNGLDKGRYQLDAVWRGPRGKDQEHTKYPFTVVRKKERIWVWLKLHRDSAAALVQFANPSAGMDEFIGQWQLRLMLNGKPLATKKFNVLC